MIDASGTKVGTVAASGATPATVSVAVDYAVGDGAYSLVRRAAGDADEQLGAIQVTDGRGTWKGEVSLPTGETVHLAMVDQHGAQVCQATLS